jgi:predicted nucleic acid-binding protein
MRPEEEEMTGLFLSRFATAPVNAGVVDAAGRLYREWNPSHGIDINDAFLAASALEAGGVVYTLNTKHFPIKELTVKRAFQPRA